MQLRHLQKRIVWNSVTIFIALLATYKFSAISCGFVGFNRAYSRFLVQLRGPNSFFRFRGACKQLSSNFLPSLSCTSIASNLYNCMLILLSPAKTLDYETPPLTKKATQPRFAERSSELVNKLKKLDPKAIGQLMHISPKLAELNYERYQSYQTTHNKDNSRQAILAFTGDVYQGMKLHEWSQSDFDAAQAKIRILSGLYGVLRPLDRIQPHRLEMGTKLENARGKNLYEFWGSTITEQLKKDLKSSSSDFVINLASNEYFLSVKPEELNGEVVTPVFKDEKNGSHKVISFYAKKARGMMADFIVRHQVKSVEELKAFKTGGYQFDVDLSNEKTLTFLRSA